MRRRTVSILGAAVLTMIQASGGNDVTRIWLRAQRAGFGFSLAFVGDDFEVPYETAFDPAYMRALFQHGEARMRAGSARVEAPPYEA